MNTLRLSPGVWGDCKEGTRQRRSELALSPRQGYRTIKTGDPRPGGITVFLEPTQTPYDLHFRVGQTPVRVHPFFWLTAVMLGWDFTRNQDGLTALGYL